MPRGLNSPEGQAVTLLTLLYSLFHSHHYFPKHKDYLHHLWSIVPFHTQNSNPFESDRKAYCNKRLTAHILLF